MKKKVVTTYPAREPWEPVSFSKMWDEVTDQLYNWWDTLWTPDLNFFQMTMARIGYALEYPLVLATTSLFWAGQNIRSKLHTQKKEVFTYIDGEKEGKYRSWYENGHPHIQASYRKGLLNGPYGEYYANGQPAEKCIYKDGRKEGPFIKFYESGQLMMKGVYKDDGYEGNYKSYHENGRLKMEATMRNGELDGLVKTYHPNGRIQGIKLYKDGKIDGLAKEYNEDGDLIKDEVYCNGTLLKGQEADDYLEEWNKQQLEKDPAWLEVTEKLAHLTDDVYYRPIKPARTPERTEKAKKLMKVRRGAELLASAMKDAEVNKKNTLLTALRKLAHPFAEEEMLQRRVFSRLRTSRKLRRKQKEL